MSQHSEETRRVLLCVALSYVSAQWKAFTFFALCFGLTGALDEPGSARFVFAHRASPIVHLIHCTIQRRRSAHAGSSSSRTCEVARF